MYENPETPSLADLLRKALAASVTMRFVAQGYHWNVRGPEFAQFHEFFGEIYEDVETAIDPLAEALRKVGEDAPFRLQELAAMCGYEVQDAGYDPVDMTGELHQLNVYVREVLTAAFYAADAERRQGIADVLAGRIDMHDKWDWQLRTTAGLDVPVPRPTELTDPMSDDPMAYELTDFETPELAVAFLASAGTTPAAALRAAWRRAVRENENPFDRARELATKGRDSRDADLLPRQN